MYGNRTTVLDGLGRSQYRLNRQDQFIDTVLVADRTVVVEIVNRLTNPLLVQILTTAPTERLIRADNLLLYKMVRSGVFRQLQYPRVITTRLLIYRRILITTRSSQRICFLLTIILVGPVEGVRTD